VKKEQDSLLTRIRSLPVAVRLLIACVICLLIGGVIVGGVLWLGRY
jgi:hypothetical protein